VKNVSTAPGHRRTPAASPTRTFLELVAPLHAGGAVKLDGKMMEGVYGRAVSPIEVLRGWERPPPQFESLYTALQVLNVYAEGAS
jgi:hypothetical protein